MALCSVTSDGCRARKQPRARSPRFEFHMQAKAALLACEALEQLETSEWHDGYEGPLRTLQLSVSLPQQADAAARGALARDVSWRKSVISSFLGSVGSALSGGSMKGSVRESLYAVDLIEVRRELGLVRRRLGRK